MSYETHDPPHGDTILLAEDNEDHVHFIKRSFMHARFLNPVQVTRDGVETIAYLNGDGPFADRGQFPFPALLLLDLKMPNKDGFEVMEWVRQHPAMRTLRIVVLTTSDRIFDVKRAYALGATGFLTKPLNLHEFIQLGPAIKGYWMWDSGEVTANNSAPVHAKKCDSRNVAFSPILSVADFPQPASTSTAAQPVVA
jgi:CheY-like chemotaxis protein